LYWTLTSCIGNPICVCINSVWRFNVFSTKWSWFSRTALPKENLESTCKSEFISSQSDYGSCL
jgi:hypothetical protein